MYEDIQKQLYTMYQEDQEMRTRENVEQEWDPEIDQRNTETLKNIVATIGWPCISKVGKDGALHAWTLVQHADDLDFMKHCLAMMQGLPKEEIEPWQCAYLIDRTRVFSGETQLYGTQFYRNEAGAIVPHPIEDPEGVNERRAAMGMGEFEEW